MRRPGFTLCLAKVSFPEEVGVDQGRFGIRVGVVYGLSRPGGALERGGVDGMEAHGRFLPVIRIGEVRGQPEGLVVAVDGERGVAPACPGLFQVVR